MSNYAFPVSGTRKRNTLSVTLSGTGTGLGLLIVGGRNIHSADNYTGVFIKKIMPKFLADRDGQLKVGDQLLQANTESLVGVSNERAIDVLKQCAGTGTVNFLIARDKAGYDEFCRLSKKLPENDQQEEGIQSMSELAMSDTTQGSEEDEELFEPPPLPPNEIGNTVGEVKHRARQLRGTVQESRLSVDPNNKFSLNKLLYAVSYIGIALSSEQLQKLHNKLHIDSRGKVVFMEFVEVVKAIVPNKFDQSKFIQAFANPGNDGGSRFEVLSEVKQLKDVNAELIGENDTLRSMVVMLQNKCGKLEKEAHTEGKITESKIMKTLAVKECEIKKLEASNRRYQVAVDIMKKFVEDCHEALVKSGLKDSITYYQVGTGSSVVRGDQITGNPRPPQYLSKHAKKTNASLANDAKDALAEVNRILNTAVLLPYGWEEEYTEDGRKYYVNHDTQSTSWVHPVTRRPPPSN